MTRNVRWQIPFGDDSGRECCIHIYDEGWTGGVTVLKGGVTPIVTQEDADKDAFAPLRLSTGQVMVMAEEETAGTDGAASAVWEMMAREDMDRYVVLTVGDDVAWQGYLTPGNNDMAWGQLPMEVMLPVRSCLAALDGVDMADGGAELMTIGELLREVITASGMAVRHVYYPDEWSAAEVREERTETMLNAEVSRAAFERLSDTAAESPEWRRMTADSMLTALRKVMTLLGWSLHESGRDVVMTTPGCTRFVRTSLEHLGVMAEETVTVTDAELPVVVGTAHTQSMVAQRHLISVEAMSDDMSDVITTVEASDADIDRRDRFDVTLRSGLRAVGFDNRSQHVGADVETYEYLLEYVWGSDGQPQLVQIVEDRRGTRFEEFQREDGVMEMHHFGARTVRWDVMTNTEEKQRLEYKDTVVVMMSPGQSMDQVPRYVLPSLEQMKDHPVMRVRSRRPLLLKDGVMCVDLGFDQRSSTGAVVRLLVRLRVGDLYWSRVGQTDRWEREESWVSVDPRHQDKESFEQYAEYNDATGYVIRCPRMLSGDVELTVAIDPTDKTSYMMCGLEQMSVRAMMPDIDYGKPRTQGNVYYANTQVSGANEGVAVELLTMGRNLPCYNAIWWKGEYLTTQLRRNGVRIRPEAALAEKMRDWYRRTRHQLRVTVMPADDVGEAARPMAIVPLTVDGRRYQPVTLSRSWRDATVTVTMTEL